MLKLVILVIIVLVIYKFLKTRTEKYHLTGGISREHCISDAKSVYLNCKRDVKPKWVPYYKDNFIMGCEKVLKTDLKKCDIIPCEKEYESCHSQTYPGSCIRNLTECAKNL